MRSRVALSTSVRMCRTLWKAKKAIFARRFYLIETRCALLVLDVPFEDDAKTAYVNAVFRKNNYERLFRDAFHDAFVAKSCVVLASGRPHQNRDR